MKYYNEMICILKLINNLNLPTKVLNRLGKKKGKKPRKIGQ